MRDRVAVVTGAGAGLGRAYALDLAARGARVLVNDLGSRLDGTGGDTRAADDVVAEIRGRGGEAEADYASVATPEGGAAIIAHAMDRFGRVDILVSNAGNMRLSSFAKLDVSTIHEIFDVHLGGSFYVSGPAYAAMSKQGYGRIVLTGSGLGAFGIYGASVYGAAKGGVFGQLQVLRLECERHGIKVNGVSPMARTRMSGDDLYAALPPEFVGPEHVAPAVAYLASEECAVNGEMWSAGAGSVSRLFVGRTQGYFKHVGDDGVITPEDLAHHLSEIRAAEGFTEPESWMAEWKQVAAMYGISP
jgi:NAD(P)-dependent dehydrogenase (short-subunit alcohol dehydrogenase family)